MLLTVLASGNPGRTYGTYTISPPNSSPTSRSAVASLKLVRLIVATSWVWAMTRCGSSACSGVSTLGGGPAPIGLQCAARHEAHHFGVAHCCGVAQRRQGRQRQAGKPCAPDGAQVGAAALDQQRVAQLDRRIATARLHQPRFPPDEIREVDELLECVDAGRGAGGPPSAVDSGRGEGCAHDAARCPRSCLTARNPITTFGIPIPSN